MKFRNHAIMAVNQIQLSSGFVGQQRFVSGTGFFFFFWGVGGVRGGNHGCSFMTGKGKAVFLSYRIELILTLLLRSALPIPGSEL